ncbi:hypothetical protein ALON55S_08272 [Alishewanella longhuensis]
MAMTVQLDVVSAEEKNLLRPCRIRAGHRQ